mmetsp:Transcript_43610/g.115186  ORF Transcript_43610/g.115186 Transcript_43610/m.115186 type:complete len:115 (+) Transcript_43610:907-1251(+)|eukprot:CAMPEP_0194494534 /NCGR_PEP_ID=MMETSP0253-20130528/12409_1 /TAXON_ID=2966 /ORGANISM="Noctiluca scintillans" /LENGTH=114 /DNA_ID=CAMNT_0039335665 /DNA_START=899 /DNA_END=1243 /DNA_ORIENTATION=+
MSESTGNSGSEARSAFGWEALLDSLLLGQQGARDVFFQIPVWASACTEQNVSAVLVSCSKLRRFLVTRRDNLLRNGRLAEEGEDVSMEVKAQPVEHVSHSQVSLQGVLSEMVPT